MIEDCRTIEEELELLKQQATELIERETDPAKISMAANILLNARVVGEAPSEERILKYIRHLRHQAWEKLNHTDHNNTTLQSC